MKNFYIIKKKLFLNLFNLFKSMIDFDIKLN